ncbi:hypothetical protein [Haloechinothrix sp. LS1_15]|uniref:hypothetical protein n=1 Tax=Haloechinothrix sp. LS1_15 TaxID=2652248 RepID=UPI00294787C2|nr:hypothetical protein [Haloechinothrix sp. LS1_15]MDV6013984.1 hypothetical protein [Haloechinothrix sp. LS1_15]
MRSVRHGVIAGFVAGIAVVLTAGIGVLLVLLLAGRNTASGQRHAEHRTVTTGADPEGEAGEIRRVAEEVIAAANARDVARFRRVLCDPSTARAEEVAEIAPNARFTLVGDPVLSVTAGRAGVRVRVEVDPGQGPEPGATAPAAEEIELILVNRGGRWCVLGAR